MYYIHIKNEETGTNFLLTRDTWQECIEAAKLQSPGVFKVGPTHPSDESDPENIAVCLDCGGYPGENIIRCPRCLAEYSSNHLT